MYWYQLVEVMLHNMEDIQICAMEVPGGNHKFPDIILIDAAMAKLMDMGILHKSNNKWNKSELYTWK